MDAIFTKTLGKTKFEICRDMLGIMNNIFRL